MIKTITIYFTDIIETVKRSLDIIGKRAVDNNGTTLFDTITVSSREEPILEDFIVTAVTTITVELRRFVEASFGKTVNSAYDFDGFITQDVTIDSVGLSERPFPSTIVFSKIKKQFLLCVGLSSPGLSVQPNYYNTWSNGAPYSNYGKPDPNVLFRYDEQLYRWNGSDLVEVYDTTELKGITISLNLADDYNEALDNTLQQAIENYCTAYALYSWFTITSPRLAEKYLADAVNHRLYFISQVFHRKTTPAENLPNPLRTLSAPT